MKSAALVFLIYFIVVAAGVSISAAQDANVSVSVASGWNLVANPLSTGTNGANQIFGPIDEEVILTWNGTGFQQVVFDSGFGGWIDPNLNRTVPPSLPPGVGFVLFNPISATTLNFTGQQVPASGTTNVITIPTGYSLLGSPLPATVLEITSAPVNLPLIDGMQILMWTGIRYDYWCYDSGFGGWVDMNFTPRRAPAYTVGQGFFVYNPGPPVAWQQSAP